MYGLCDLRYSKLVPIIGYTVSYNIAKPFTELIVRVRGQIDPVKPVEMLHEQMKNAVTDWIGRLSGKGIMLYIGIYSSENVILDLL